jgi:hypothetical protein
MNVYLVKSIGLNVELPMLVELNNNGARDFANSWSEGEGTRHVDVPCFISGT